MCPVEGGASGFSVSTSIQDGVLLLTIRGELDADTTRTTARELDAAAHAGVDVVVDLGGTTFLDSAGLYALMVLRKRLDEASRRLAIACWPDGPVAMTFRVSGTDDLFALYATRTDALDALRDGSPG
jgi:anti-sigma B factor antagonist